MIKFIKSLFKKKDTTSLQFNTPCNISANSYRYKFTIPTKKLSRQEAENVLAAMIKMYNENEHDFSKIDELKSNTETKLKFEKNYFF